LDAMKLLLRKIPKESLAKYREELQQWVTVIRSKTNRFEEIADDWNAMFDCYQVSEDS